MRDDVERLQDILEAIERIEKYQKLGRGAFDREELIQSWFVRHIQIVGEAVRALPESIRILSPETPWRQIIGMRHILVHSYFDIDRDAVWHVASVDLPTLKLAIRDLLTRLRAG